MVREAAVAAGFSGLASRAGATEVQQASPRRPASARARITREALRAAGDLATRYACACEERSQQANSETLLAGEARVFCLI